MVDASAENLQADRATGFVFDAASVAALDAALQRAADVFAKDRSTWEQLQRRAMAQDFSWQGAAAQYLELYRAIAPG